MRFRESVVFENKFATKILSEIKSKYDYNILQLYCYANLQVLYERYKKRDDSGQRHPGHIIQINGLEEFKNRASSKNFKLDIGDTTIDIDTSKFEDKIGRAHV